MTVKKTNEVIQLEYGNNVLIVSGDINDMNWGGTSDEKIILSSQEIEFEI